MNQYVSVCMYVCALHEILCVQHNHFLWMPTLVFWSHLCGDRENERRGKEEEGGDKKGETVHLDLLSSVAVVGQGRPSLGDAHNQFFWRNRVKYDVLKHKNKNVCNLHSK